MAAGKMRAADERANNLKKNIAFYQNCLYFYPAYKL
jgi:hypothetical protein